MRAWTYQNIISGTKVINKIVTNQKYIHNEIKSKSNLGNVDTFQFRNFCSPISYLNHKVQIYRSIILSVVLYGCETWYLSLREEHRSRVCENRVLRNTSGQKTGENCTMRSSIIYTFHQKILG
jgi:hypothetical protein